MPLPLVFGLLRRGVTATFGPAVQFVKYGPFFGIGVYLAASRNVLRAVRLERTAVAARVGNVEKDLLGSELVLKDDEKETWVINQDDTDHLPWLNGIIREFWPKISQAVEVE